MIYTIKHSTFLLDKKIYTDIVMLKIKDLVSLYRILSLCDVELT